MQQVFGPKMKRTSFAGMDCTIARTLEVVGEWWSLLIVKLALYGVTRFGDFQTELGISRNVLSQRLKRLTDAGILARRPDRQGSKYPEYQLTTKGAELAIPLIALMQWGDRWETSKEGPPIEVIDSKSDTRIGALRISDLQGKPLELAELGYRRLRPKR
jgi:DNA-binding HxlR family transcriptional regulator